MNCLLCQRPVSEKLSFQELFLLKSPTAGLCGKCQESFQLISPAHCPRCYKDGISEICPDCLEWEEKGIYIQHEAIFKYNDAMHDFFRQYKFLGDYRLRACFAKFFSASLKKQKSFILVPIPLSEQRLQERAFNQVEGFLEAAKLPYDSILQKTETGAQSALTRSERLATKNSFSLAKTANLPKKVILVDDIYTTGTTLEHTRQVLYEAGVKEIKSFSLCR